MTTGGVVAAGGVRRWLHRCAAAWSMPGTFWIPGSLIWGLIVFGGTRCGGVRGGGVVGGAVGGGVTMMPGTLKPGTVGGVRSEEAASLAGPEV